MARLSPALLLLASALAAAETKPELSNCPPMPPGTPPPKVLIGTTHEVVAATAAEARLAADTVTEARWRPLLRQEDALARRAAIHLVAFMPARDLARLDPAFVGENLRLALAARAEFAWAREIPEALFVNDVAPYATLDEDREPIRSWMLERLRPVVAAAKDRREAILAVNRALPGIAKVVYSTKRRAPNQCSSDSIRQGVASCTGLSILLVDAFRAVGIPARIAGCATWVTVQGNHNWVEVWDNGWHITEYSLDPKGLGHAWFRDRAAFADPERPETRILATSWAPVEGGQPFPLVWNLRSRDVHGVDRTADYHAWAGGRQAVLGKRESLLGVRVFRGDTREPTEVAVLQDGREIARVRTAGPGQDMMDVPWTRLSLDGGKVTLRAGALARDIELRGGEETVVDLRLAP
jgi:transglutaminase-like putative cysteine protease